LVQREKYEVYISDIVVADIEATKNLETRTKLLNVLTAYPIRFVTEKMSPEIVRLADFYLQPGAIPLKSQVDAFHLAIAVVNQMDILLTWNYKHLANVNLVGSSNWPGHFERFSRWQVSTGDFSDSMKCHFL